MASISFQGKITERHYIRAQRLHAGWRFFLVPIMVLVMFTLLVVPRLRHLSTERILLMGVVFLVALVIPFLVNPVAHRRYFRRSTLLQAPLSGSVSDEFFELSSQHGQTRFEWRFFVNAVVADEMILLYQQPRLFNILSRDFFSSAADWSAVTSLVKERVKKVRVA